MSKSNRRRHAASLAYVFSAGLIAIVVYTAYAFGTLNAEYAAQANGYAAQYAANAEKQIQETCALGNPVAFRECVVEIVTATHEAQRSEHDLEAQRKMAKWAAWLLVVGAVQLGASLVGIYYIRNTLLQSTVSSERQLRAYVGVGPYKNGADGDEVNPKIFSVGGFQCIHFTVVAKNYGQTPAFKLHHKMEVVFLKDGEEPIWRSTFNKTDVVINPTKQFRFDETYYDLTDTRLAMIKRNEAKILISGQIKYRDTFRRWRITNFRFKYDARAMKGGYLIGTNEGNNST